MIYDSLKHLDAYKGIYPQITRALEIIRDTDFSQLEDGTYEVDGFNFRYMLQSYTVENYNDTPESHQNFIDIQYMISGKELMGVAPLEEMSEVVMSNPEGDIWLHRGSFDTVTVCGDRFVVFFPGDAHAPGIVPPEGPMPVRKCVFKIHI